MKMKCIIVDDEPLAREGMELNVNDTKALELVGQFGTAAEANNFLAEHDVDLMFLDIEMPGMNGLEFIKALRKKPLIILTTAYPEYALQGFELNVVDYLVKPIRLQRFISAVNKAIELHELKKSNRVTGSVGGNNFIYLKSERKFVKVLLKDITYIKGMKDYVMVNTIDSNIMTAMNIKTIFKQLDDPAFVRISKSYIINTRYIDEVNQHSVMIKDTEIPIGKTYRDAFINDYIKDHLLQR